MAGKKSLYKDKPAPEFMSDEWFGQTEQDSEALTEAEIDEQIRKEELERKKPKKD